MIAIWLKQVQENESKKGKITSENSPTKGNKPLKKKKFVEIYDSLSMHLSKLTDFEGITAELQIPQKKIRK